MKEPRRLHVVPGRDWIRHESRCVRHQGDGEWWCVVFGTALYGVRVDEILVDRDPIVSGSQWANENRYLEHARCRLAPGGVMVPAERHANGSDAA